MKINLVQRDISLNQGNFGLLSESSNFREKNNMQAKNNRGYNAMNCGSFTGKSEAAASFCNKIIEHPWFTKLTETSEAHNVGTSALIALGLAGVLRPATTMALPGQKDKEDKIYASGHAIASALMGFVVSWILTSPLDDAFTKTFDASKKLVYRDLIKPEDNVEKLEKRASKKLVEMFKKLKSLEDLAETATKEQKAKAKALTLKSDAMKILVKTMPEWVIAVPRATLTIALIPPILKYVFGLEKKKKAPNNNIMNKIDFIEKPAFKAIKGGVQ